MTLKVILLNSVIACRPFSKITQAFPSLIRQGCLNFFAVSKPRVNVHNCFLLDLPLIVHVLIIFCIFDQLLSFLTLRSPLEVCELSWFLLIEPYMTSFRTSVSTVKFDKLICCLKCVVGHKLSFEQLLNLI